MKNKFKKLVMLVLALSMVFTLCACGGNSSATNGSEGNKGSENSKNSEVIGESESESEKNKITEIPLSQCFNGENRVWYLTSGTQKTSTVEAVLICKEGKLYWYGPSDYYAGDPFWEFFNWTLGDVAKMTDEEIIETMENTISAQLKEALKAEKSAADTFLPKVNLEKEYYEMDYTYPSGDTIRYFVPTADLKEYYNNLDKIYSLENYVVDTNFSLFTDDTGNYVSYEKMEFISNKIIMGSAMKECSSIFSDLAQGMTCDAVDWIQYEHEVYATGLRQSTYSNGGYHMESNELIQGGAYPVYDSVYGGLRLLDSSYLLTRADSDTFFVLDELGTEGIEVDLKTEN